MGRELELNEEIHMLKTSVDEVRLRIEQLTALAQKEGMGNEVAGLLSQAGLDVFEGRSRRMVFLRLYEDFFKRCQRLEDMRKVLYEKNMHIFFLQEDVLRDLEPPLEI